MANFEDAWNEYWQSGLSTSCVSNGEDSYPPAIEKFWEKFFLILKDGDHIADLCTGGGGVPQLIIDYCENKNLQLDIAMTDLAIIQNKLLTKKGVNITYHSECNCEEQPFKNAEFNIVTSSFGIEYSDSSKTAKEIYRTLKAGGYFATVMHCYDSEIVKNSNKQLKQAFDILYEYNFFPLFKKTYLSKSKSRVFQKSAEKKLRACLEDIKTKLLHNKDLHVYRMVLNAAHDIFVYGQTNKPVKCIEYINETENALISNYQRMKNLSEVVLSSNKIEAFIEEIESIGFSVIYNKKIISDENKILGLGLICKK